MPDQYRHDLIDMTSFYVFSVRSRCWVGFGWTRVRVNPDSGSGEPGFGWVICWCLQRGFSVVRADPAYPYHSPINHTLKCVRGILGTVLRYKGVTSRIQSVYIHSQQLSWNLITAIINSHITFISPQCKDCMGVIVIIFYLMVQSFQCHWSFLIMNFISNLYVHACSYFNCALT